MPIFAKTISLTSALPRERLLERIRTLAKGEQRPRRRWRSAVMWKLREEPDGTIQLMPLSPPDYRTQQPRFAGTIEAEGTGSRARGLVTPYPLTVWITAFLLIMDTFMSIGGIVQEISRGVPLQALFFALFGVVFAAFAVGFFRLAMLWSVEDIQQLLETAASNDPVPTVEAQMTQPTGPIVDNRTRPSNRAALVLRTAAVVDLLIAAFVIASPLLRSRIGGPMTVVFAAALAIGAVVVLVIAARLK